MKITKARLRCKHRKHGETFTFTTWEPEELATELYDYDLQLAHDRLGDEYRLHIEYRVDGEWLSLHQYLELKSAQGNT